MTTLLVLAAFLVGVHLVLLEIELMLARHAEQALREPGLAGRDPGRGSGADPCLGPLFGLPPRPAAGCSPAVPSASGAAAGPAEAVLLKRLVAGEISRERYRAEMARLAREDERVHPVGPPPV